MSNDLQAADKVLQMLLAFSRERPALGVGQLAEILAVHKSTASRLAATLAARGFLERVPASRAFRLGPEMGRLGLLAWEGRDLVSLARDAMERLARETGETVNLAFLDGTEAVNVAQVDGPHIIGIGYWAGRRNKLHGAANGKILLAFVGAPIGEGPYEAFTDRTITGAEKLRAELEEVKRQGWAMAVGELEAELNAVAAPVFDALGRCRAALSVAGPAYRLPRARLPELARLCVEAAREIGLRLGAPSHAA
jgi:DNA-binding IclR family transcriptional regulator